MSARLGMRAGVDSLYKSLDAEVQQSRSCRAFVGLSSQVVLQRQTLCYAESEKCLYMYMYTYIFIFINTGPKKGLSSRHLRLHMVWSEAASSRDMCTGSPNVSPFKEMVCYHP